MNQETQDSGFEKRTREVLDESASRLDGRTLSKLTQARHAALEQLQRPARSRWWFFAPAGAAAAVAVLAVMTWTGGTRPTVTAPVAALNDAQRGAFAIENVSGSPSASLAVGWNEYAVPFITCVVGLPEITGARFVGATLPTAIVNAGSCAVACPSLTRMTMFE